MALSAEGSQIAHLLRRAGFGASPAEWNHYSQLGFSGAVDALLHPERAEDTMSKMQRELGGDFVDFEDFYSIRNWWLYRMTHSPRPLEEKMTLFWHNHFATAAYKVYDPKRMWAQNETFRRYGLGSFRTLLQQVARDPAMLQWLDGADNHAGAPNENFAREVMELFTLGRGNGYTETDVKEAARAFTGWKWSNTPSNFVYQPGLARRRREDRPRRDRQLARRRRAGHFGPPPRDRQAHFDQAVSLLRGRRAVRRRFVALNGRLPSTPISISARFSRPCSRPTPSRRPPPASPKSKARPSSP